MAAPKKANTAAATAAAAAARVRDGQNTKARSLRSGGWLVIPPEDTAVILQALAVQPDFSHWLTGAVSEETRNNIHDLTSGPR